MFCESFRSTEPPPKVAVVGILLTMKSEVEIVFSGLRILEDLVKYSWATLECRDLVKVVIKHESLGGELYRM